MASVNFPLTHSLWSRIPLSETAGAGPGQKEGASLRSRCWTVVAATVALLVTPLFFLMDLVYLAVRKIFCYENSPGNGDSRTSALFSQHANGGNKVDCVEFYKGSANSDGLTLDQIRSWNDDRLESVHTFIQWLFPLKKQSSVNPAAPTIQNATIKAFHSDPVLRGNLLISFNRMLRFYGLVLDEKSMTISRAANFSERAKNFLTPDNHNFLRITRIISCLSTLGLKPQAQAFLRVMENISQKEGKGIVSSENLRYWRKALR